jgi:hypothetical protein
MVSKMVILPSCDCIDMNVLQRREKSIVHSMDKGIKTTPEFTNKTWKIIQQSKGMLAGKKIMPSFQEYLTLSEEIHAIFSL